MIAAGLKVLDFYSDIFIQVNGNTAALYVLILSTVILFAWISFFVFWTTYYLDYWIITDRRILDMDTINLFDENAATIRVENIEDAVIETKGLFSHLLNFGSILVQSAGSEREFKIRNVPDPQGIKNKIFEIQSKLLKEPRDVRIVSDDVNKKLS